MYAHFKPRTISIKLAQDDYLLIARQASALGMNPTEFVRRFTVQSAKILEQGGFPENATL
ncbi:hypothetical protein H6G45_06390 [Synechocystis sp. FACHB-383]|uniref:hypothetical protein n=1 Tax=Synechocystis sp. FACHB-383 TaxID=2692864 RepID=UPI0016830638|nr:hypothetical protein [Synechocystis sp. FACHB-383]MBD2653121.1 hypothetical protein [Synechocystis sp. FACHB-383]